MTGALTGTADFDAYGTARASSGSTDHVFDAVRENRFYVLAAQDVMYEWTKMGHARMWEGRNPAVPRRLLALSLSL